MRLERKLIEVLTTIKKFILPLRMGKVKGSVSISLSSPSVSLCNSPQHTFLFSDMYL